MSHASDLTLVNADLGDGSRTTVKIAGTRIAALGARPRPGETILDLHGSRLLPGLINAHDHLQLNHLPRLQPARRYVHVRGWIAEIDKWRRTPGPLQAAVAVPLEQRLFLGGVKNLLSGVTTVAHHDPLHAPLCAVDYPVRVVQRYGWAHSLYMEGEARVLESQRRTPPDWPWIIHAAEGVDEEAQEEFWRLERLGCLRPNTLIVHGVALGPAERQRLVAASAALIWCPSSNCHLFGATAMVAELAAAGRVALGTDSRLTGSRDLLTELHHASSHAPLGSESLQALVTRDAARLLHLPDCGVIAPGARADLVVLAGGMTLERARRADLRLVMVAGAALYGDPDLTQDLGPADHWHGVVVDGRTKALAGRIAQRLASLSLHEPGLRLLEQTLCGARPLRCAADGGEALERR
jgi:cytosine/adenosine deaminase-related metal-dependent hydrolase